MKIRKTSTDHIGATNKTQYVNLDVTSTSKQLLYDKNITTVNLNKQFLSERDACTNYRVMLTFKPYCSNVLFNPCTEITYIDSEGKLCAVTENDAASCSTAYGKTNNITRNYMVRNTEYSSEKNGFEYHPGLDIFNNHIIRNVSYRIVNKLSDNANVTDRNKFNTLEDKMRLADGSTLKKCCRLDIDDFDTKDKSLYDVDDILSFSEGDAINENLEEDNGWFGFYNTSTIEAKDSDGNSMDISRVINNKSNGEFVDMYPGRDLFSFSPQYNSLRERVEYNWDIALTYPYENTTKDGNGDDLKVIQSGDLNALLIADAKMIRLPSNKTGILFRTFTKHNLQKDDKIKMYFNEDSDNNGQADVWYEIEDELKVHEIGDVNGDNEDYYFTVDSVDLLDRIFCTPKDDDTYTRWDYIRDYFYQQIVKNSSGKYVVGSYEIPEYDSTKFNTDPYKVNSVVVNNDVLYLCVNEKTDSMTELTYLNKAFSTLDNVCMKYDGFKRDQFSTYQENKIYNIGSNVIYNGAIYTGIDINIEKDNTPTYESGHYVIIDGLLVSAEGKTTGDTYTKKEFSDSFMQYEHCFDVFEVICSDAFNTPKDITWTKSGSTITGTLEASKSTLGIMYLVPYSGTSKVYKYTVYKTEIDASNGYKWSYDEDIQSDYNYSFPGGGLNNFPTADDAFIKSGDKFYTLFNHDTNISYPSVSTTADADDFIMGIVNNAFRIEDGDNQQQETETPWNDYISFRFKKVIGDVESKYYVRKFKKLPFDLNDERYKVAFSNTIYGDDVSQVTYTDAIDIDGLVDNNGRDISEIYATIVKSNRGYDKWYIDTDFDDETIENSHCFGPVTSGFDYFSTTIDSNDIINKRLGSYDVKLLQNTFSKDEDEDEKLSIDESINLDSEFITIDDDTFYGDIVEYNAATCDETVICEVNYRFNTFQREFSQDTSNPDYKFEYDDIDKDDYDNPNGGIVLETHEISAENMLKHEGYYYKPHYKIRLRGTGYLNQGNHRSLFILKTVPYQANGMFIKVTTKTNHKLLSGDRVIVIDKIQSYEWILDVMDVIDKNTFIMNKVDNTDTHYVDLCTFCKNINDGNYIMRAVNENIPTYAGKVGYNTYYWKNTVGLWEDSNQEDLPFANNSLYIDNSYNFYLKRQNSDSSLDAYFYEDTEEILKDVSGLKVETKSNYDYKEESQSKC